MNQNNAVSSPEWKDVGKNLLFIFLTIGVAYVVTVFIGLDNLRTKVAETGIYASFIVLLLKATTIVVAPLGGTIIYPIAGAIFGFWKGLAITLLGDAVGSSIAFWISRRFGRRVLHYFTAKAQAPIVEKVVAELGDRRKFVKARIFFFGFMDLFAYAAGLTTINFWFFITVHMAVHSVLVILYVAFGDLLISGKFAVVFVIGILSTVFALLGAWLFRLDLLKGN